MEPYSRVAAVAAAIYGPDSWQTALDAVGFAGRSTLARWRRGSAVPPDIDKRLRALVRMRRAELAEHARELRRLERLI